MSAIDEALYQTWHTLVPDGVAEAVKLSKFTCGQIQDGERCLY